MYSYNVHKCILFSHTYAHICDYLFSFCIHLSKYILYTFLSVLFFTHLRIIYNGIMIMVDSKFVFVYMFR